MKINECVIKNLHSFEDVKFNFEDYNVLVGTNNSGKTNLIRIFSLLQVADSVERLRIDKNIRLNSDSPSYLYIKFSLTPDELKLLLELIFQQDLDPKKFHNKITIVELLLAWEDVILDSPIPLVLCRFANGFTIYAQNNNYFSTYTNEIASYVSMVSHLNSLNLLDGETVHNYESEHGFHPSYMLTNDTFANDFFNGNKIEYYFTVQQKLIKCAITSRVNFDENNPRRYVSSSIDFIGGNKVYGTSSDPWLVLTNFFKKKLVIVRETIPSDHDLTDYLLGLKLNDEKQYDGLKKGFSEIFDGISFVVNEKRMGTQTHKQIVMLEGGKEYPLKVSASGHLAALNILYNVLGRKDSTIILDEPETHFHPTKISLLGKTLINLSKDSKNQITTITHSPRFLDSLLIHYKEYNIIFVKKTNIVTEVRTALKTFTPKVPPHIFNPEVFFEKCVILVEGPGDEFALKAISDAYDGLFIKYNIALVSAWHVNKIDSYAEILDAYGIPYVGLCDKQYQGSNPDVLKLSENLEEELESLGWARQSNEHLRPLQAYSFVIKLAQSEEGKEKLEKSNLAKVIINALKKLGIKDPFRNPLESSFKDAFESLMEYYENSDD